MKNGLQVISSLESNLLLRMIKGKRFDYYPRSVVEAWYELAQLRDADLKIEDHLMLSYVADLFFYVQRDNAELANRIEAGLKILIRNGEFDRYFYSDSRVQEALQKLNAPGRITIELSNSQVNDAVATPPHYWLRLGAN